ncbi:ElaB/YqjD/DUF883 family membrane-anchored ribosome-binding protein [Rhodoblastus acidophilus]|uniref:DUF3618 domain-containing protein n=1 Tax=Rhodoblastus acidophilus TaxID=1074 RepID=UPI00222491D0|nr:DUF3618 domain-containing protein [Rhodoblastus acidophilus]MCW2284583.1 ElaB/YqjD/DUF883 family membrane-anchored ribosome-binding protein [Rhodoblastus acidophilus]MCW2333536.1 ElaB/YqjD/DUF883 family membrane-anchored ribosome-binding protein [Rhodoblastus acidophilus]
MTYSEQLEREAELTRSQLADTIGELRTAMTPGQVVDQLLERVGGGDAATLLTNLKKQAVDNPAPLALIGAGVAWLMFGGGNTRRNGGVADMSGEWMEGAEGSVEAMRDSTAETARAWSGAASDAAESVRQRASDAAERARRRAAETGHAVKETAGAAVNSVRSAASSGAHSLSHGARTAAHGVATSVSATRQRAMHTGAAFASFCREQPLVLAGLGLAIGAAVGALAPQSEAEERALADTAAKLRESAEQGLEAAKEAAQGAAQGAFEGAFEGAAAKAESAGEKRKPSGQTKESGEDTAKAVDELGSAPLQQTARGA